MGRNIPFPNNGPKNLDAQVKPLECECGNSRFRQSQDVMVLQDRLNPKMVGFAQVMELICVKCSAVYEMKPEGIQKIEQPQQEVPPNG